MAFILGMVGRLGCVRAAAWRLACALLLLLACQHAGAVNLTAVTFTSTIPTQTAVATVYVKASESFTANLSGNTNDSTANWRGTGWRISTTSGGYSCFNNTNFDSNNASTTLPITMTAPASGGTYNVYFQAYTSNTCTGATGSAVFATNVIVVDATIPVLQTVACSVPAVCGTSNPTNATSVSWALTFSEAVTGLTAANFTLATTGVTGASITGVSGSGTSWTVTANTGSGNGTVGLNMASSLTTIIDQAGNNPVAVNAVAGNTYTIDKVAPVITGATIASNNPTTTLAKVGNIVTVTFTTTGAAATPLPVVTIAGRAATVSGGPNTWTATQTMAAGDAEGTVPFTINLSDAAGNAATPLSTATGPSVTFDKTAPTVTSIFCTTPATCGTSNPTNATQVSWTVTFSEVVTGVAASNFVLSGSGSNIVVSGSGNSRTVTADTGADGTTIAINLTANLSSIADAAGNPMTIGASGSAGNTYTIDKSAPQITLATIVSNNAVSTSMAKVGDTVTLSFTTSGTAASPLPVVTIAGRAATVSGGPSSWTATVVMAAGDASGVIPFAINVSDAAGNAAPTRTAITSGSEVTFDKTAPTAAISCSSPATCGVNNVSTTSTVTWRVLFSEAVTGLTAANFGFSGDLGGSASIAPGGITGSGTTYFVTVNGNGVSGTLGLNLVASLTTIIDAAGNNPAAVTADADNTYTINTRPVATITCSSPAVCGPGNPTNVASVTWAVTFNQSVTGVTAGNFTLSGTGTNGASITGVGGSGMNWTVTATTGDDGTLGLNLSSNLSSIVNASSVSPLAVAAESSNTYTKNALAACFTDDFNRASLGSDWATTSSSGSFGQPVIVGNRLRLTSNTTNSSTAAHLQRIFPASGNKVVIEFDYYGYEGNGADGVAVNLSDANIAPVAGAFGGSLGYAQKSNPGSDCTTFGGCPGFAGGWIGIGLDEYGNFSTADEGRIGGTTALADAVVVRGSGSGQSGYSYHRRSVALSPGIDVSGATPGPGHRYRITIDHTDGTHAYVSVDRDSTVGHTAYTQVIAPYDAKAEAGQAAVPANWFLSYTGTTGAFSNTHEIDNLQVCTTRPIALPVLHHVRIVHDGVAATCAPETVTLRACGDATCSSLYLGSVEVNLASSDGTWSADPVTFTGGQTTVTLTKTSVGSATLSGTVTSPAATLGAAQCYNVNTAGDCVLPFSAASCAFDVVQAGKMAGSPINTKLAGTAFNLDVLAISGGAINGSYAGTVTPVLVDQNSTHDANGCGNVVLAGASPASIAMTAAGHAGRAPFSFNYASAAADVRVKVTSSTGETACSNDNFAIRPANFGIITDASNGTLDPVTGKLKGAPVVKAGASFSIAAIPRNEANVAITGYTGTAAFFSDLFTAQTTTEVMGQFTGSFGQATGTVDGSVGNFTYSDAGGIALGNYAIYDANFAAVDRFKSAPECFTDEYLGTTHALSKAPNTFDENNQVACFFGSSATAMGRFIPDHFDTVITPVASAPMPCPYGGTACPLRFAGAVYSAQQFTMQVVAKRSGAGTLASDGVVRNYNTTAGYARSNVSLSAWSERGTTTQANPPASPAGHALTVTTVPSTAFNEGVATLTDQAYTFGKAYSAATPTAIGDWIAPTNIYIRAVESGSDSDAVTTVRSTVADSEEAGIQVLSGRLYVPHVHGSELLRLRVPLLAQYWNGSRWTTSVIDSVSTFSTAHVVKSGYLKGLNASNTVIVSQGATTLVKGAGQFFMQAPGAGVAGSVDFSVSAVGRPAWLPSTVGRSRVGTYRSPLIYIREVY